MVTLEWLAGFFDGEGCVRLHPGRLNANTFSPLISLTQKDQKILEAVQKGFGGKLYRYKLWASVVRWHGADAVKLARLLLPYSNCKRRQLYLLLKAAEVPTTSRGPFDLALRAEKKNIKVS